jgi:phosphotriesterase-related protein
MVITTVLGDLAPEELGFCQSHEHLFIGRGRSAEINPVLCIDDLSKSLAELEGYYRAGGRALVDAQPPDCGRDARALAELSRRTGVHIIASTGFHRMIYYPENHTIFKAGADELTSFFLGELNQGMYVEEEPACAEPGFGVPAGGQSAGRAGQIKTALEKGAFDRQSQKLFIAAAEAAKESGCAVMVHVERDADPIALADFLQKEGLAPEQLIFCHLDRAIGDLGVHRELCRRGAYLEYDTIGRPKYHSDEREAEIVLQMTEAGFAGQLLMSLDVTRARLSSYGGSPGLCHLIESFIPLLKSRGLTEDHIRLFFADNPSKAFARDTKKRPVCHKTGRQ